jgi:hypothetical protein
MLFEEVDLPHVVMHITLLMNCLVAIKSNQSQEFLEKYLLPRIMLIAEQDKDELRAEVKKADIDLHGTKRGERTDH